MNYLLNYGTLIVSAGTNNLAYSLQEQEVLAELQGYVNTVPPPEDVLTVNAAVKFLQACNALFERGLLSKHGWINSTPNPITNSITKGYTFFSNWYDQLLTTGE